HAFSSLQAAVLFAWRQPCSGSQRSSVQRFSSSQFGAGPPTQEPAEQWSAVVQALPSSRSAVLCVWTEPRAGSQESSVQTFPSSHLGAAPPTHEPAEQRSAVVHALPSSQLAVLSAWTQPCAGSQESSVQTFPSSQFGATPPTQEPAEQRSAVVQGLPSS